VALIAPGKAVMVTLQNPAPVDSTSSADDDQLTVHNPMGFPPKVTGKALAPRLDTLNGKTVFLVDCHFDDSGLLLEQVQAWFGEHLPEVQVRFVAKANVYGRDDPELWARIKAEGDAAIIGVGHCSSCAPAVAAHGMSLDGAFGVPTVMLHTATFERVVRSTARMHGMPRMRAAFVPMPVMGKTPIELRAYVDGNDPTTGRPVMQEIVDGLTRSLEAVDVAGESFERSTPRFVAPDNEQNLHELFLSNHWTDTLPIVLPTDDLVQQMLAHTSHGPDEIVGHMRATGHREAWAFNVEKVAVNAVMAGARPEYFPVILALASTGVSSRGSSTSSMASLVVVNGPIRDEIEMNSSIGAMGPYNQANSTIGRANSLLSQNLQGGSVSGLSYMGSQGNGYSFTNVTFAENEERSPWEPFHVEQGFAESTSTVSVFGSVWHTGFTLGLRKGHWRDALRRMLLGMDPLCKPLFVLDPIAARQFVERGGFHTKADLASWAAETARIPAGEYWDYQLIQNYIYPRAAFGEEPYASMLKAPPDELIPMFTAEGIHTVVVGGETNGYWRLFSASHVKTISVDDWR
jgi:hypothetical protein